MSDDQSADLERLASQIRSLDARVSAAERRTMAELLGGTPARMGAFGGLPSAETGGGPYQYEPIIAADSITADQIAAGSITTNEIAIAQTLPAANMLRNGGFRDSFAGWTAVASGAPGFSNAMWSASATDYTLRDGDIDGWAPGGPYGSTAYIRGTNTSSTLFPYVYQDVPVTAGEWYSVSALFGLHRLTLAYLELQFFNAAGSWLGGVNSATFPSSPSAKAGGPARTDWEYLTIDGAQAPAGAERGRLHLVAKTPNVSGSDWYLFMDQVWMGVGKRSRPFDPNEVFGVRNVTGGTIIDSTGIHVTNGEITVENPGSVVIIDGTSNMFKIAAQGTLECTQDANTGGAGIVALTALGTLTATPAHNSFVGREDEQGLVTPRYLGGRLLIPASPAGYVAATSGGSPTMRTGPIFGQYQISTFLEDEGAQQDTPKVSLGFRNWDTVEHTVYGTFYVLKEAAM